MPPKGGKGVSEHEGVAASVSQLKLSRAFPSSCLPALGGKSEDQK